MRIQLILFSVLGIITAQADILTSTQRFFGMGGQVPGYSEREEGDVDRTWLGQAPYSPADSDLGVQEILLERNEIEPIMFNLSTSILRTDTAVTGNFASVDESSWVSASRASLTWRPHIFQGWYGDLALTQDLVRYDRAAALDFENLGLRAGIYKNLPDLDDTTVFARYEYQRITFGSLGESFYNAQRIRAGLQKSLWAAPRHRLTGSLSGAYEWTAQPTELERNEVAIDLAYRYSITDSLHTVTSARLSRFHYDELGRKDWNIGAGIELVWQIDANFNASASLYFEKNESNTLGDFNEYESWASGLGFSAQWLF
jgi:hypothetical protein